MPLIASRTIAGLQVAEHVIGAFGEASLPLVVSLHGRGGRPELPFGACASPCRVLVPQGPVELGEGYAWSKHYARARKDGALARDLEDVAARLEEVLDTVRRERGARGRTIALGFSQGAMAALALAMRPSDPIGDLVAGATWWPEKRTLERAPTTRIRLAHGAADAVVPFAWASAFVDRFRALGADIELESFPNVGHESSREMDACLVRWRDAAIERAASE